MIWKCTSILRAEAMPDGPFARARFRISGRGNARFD
jgi:hypothetical protein